MNYRKGYAHGRAHSKEKVQEALKLRESGLSMREISELTQIPLDTLKGWFSRKHTRHIYENEIH